MSINWNLVTGARVPAASGDSMYLNVVIQQPRAADNFLRSHAQNFLIDGLIVERHPGEERHETLKRNGV